MKFKRGADPIKTLGIGYKGKKETKSWKVLEFIGSKGEEGASLTEIQYFIWTELNGYPEQKFWEKSRDIIWGGKLEPGKRASRGYWTANLYGGNPYLSKGPSPGLLYKYCKKNEKGKWVLQRMPRPGENILESEQIKVVSESLSENLKFKRKKDHRESIGIGIRNKVMNFLRWVRNDFQMDKDHPDYFGYINLSEDDFGDPELQEGFRLFVENWEKFGEKMMNDMNMILHSGPDLDETIIADADFY